MADTVYTPFEVWLCSKMYSDGRIVFFDPENL